MHYTYTGTCVFVVPIRDRPWQSLFLTYIHSCGIPFIQPVQGLHVIVQGIHVTSANVNAVTQMVLEKLQQIESSLTVQLGRCKIQRSAASDFVAIPHMYIGGLLI